MVDVVAHRPRVAWEGARAFMRVIEAGRYRWLADVLGERIGREAQDQAVASAVRLGARPDSTFAETGLWRAYLDDLIATRPAVTRPLLDIIEEARAVGAR
jgi:hypothetical protein